MPSCLDRCARSARMSAGAAALAAPSNAAPMRNGTLVVVAGECGGTDCYVEAYALDGDRARALRGTDTNELGGLAFSPDGRALALARLRDVPGGYVREYIVRRPWSSTAERLIVQRSGDAFLAGASWSADGTSIALTQQEGDRSVIYVAPVAGGPPRRLRSGECPAWSARGRIAFIDHRSFGDGLGVLYTMRSDGSALRRVASHADTPTWSPDGRRIAYIGPHNGMYVIDAAGRRAHRVAGAASLPTWSPDGRLIAFIRDRQGNIHGGWLGFVSPDGGGLRTTAPRGVDGGEFSALAWQPTPHR
jgi:Tol biopolymer transport system component